MEKGEGKERILTDIKADAISKLLHTEGVTNTVPATILKEHPDVIVYVDLDSAKGILK